MRYASLFLILGGIAWADGGNFSCPSDYTYDSVRTVLWKAKVKAVYRNGVSVGTGKYSFSKSQGIYPIQLLDSLRLSSPYSYECKSVWKCIQIDGKGISTELIRN